MASTNPRFGDAALYAESFVIYTVPLTNANQEYSQALPANCKRVAFQARTSAIVRFAFVTGKVATPTEPYMTLRSDHAYDSGGMNLASATLYLATPTAGTVVEIEAWN